ncbi:hypothetical protein CALVIDRAFT_556751 [Calocera viscosa TUFC12733]|uniref:Protein BIG1 n=1 Tax=Calocera viscosa (strain TUFC12733) TaxID=1330018 RepID=A0A167JND3_CALVF|nr:hypothetical protein CALVIDRAFT_556751 [Calocera viscosa TUFC12733]
MARLTLAALLALAGSAVAFRGTVPFVAWSTEPSCHLSNLQTESTVTEWDRALQILSVGDLCSHEGIVLVEQSGLHASDLSLLPSSSRLSRRLRSSASLFQAPRLRLPADLPFDALARNITSLCGHVDGNWESLELGNVRPDTRYLFRLEMPALKGSVAYRRIMMKEYENLLSDRLESIAALFPSHLVLLSGTPLPPLSFTKRDVDGAISHPPAPFYDTMQIVLSSDSPADGPFLSRYQILTPGLISALLVVFVVFLPILMVGIGAVASIQSPARMDAPKGVSQEKKHQ